MTAPVSRRGLIAAAALLPTTAGLPTVATASLLASTPWPDAGLSTLAALGRLAVERGLMTGDEPVPPALAATFGSPPDAAALRGIIAADFAAGRTVALDGWRLSDTELRLSVLAYRAASA